MIRAMDALSVLLMVLTLAPTATFAADKNLVSPPSEAVARAAAGAESIQGPGTVRFFNRDIVTLKTAYFGYQPSQRAAAATQRIRNQLRRPAVLSALNANVQDVFNEYGVQIMSPHYLGDPSAPVVVPKERWFEPPGAGQSASVVPR